MSDTITAWPAPDGDEAGIRGRGSTTQPFIRARAAPAVASTSCPAATRTVSPRTTAPTTSGHPPEKAVHDSGNRFHFNQNIEPSNGW